jgi:hypothetical protein
LRFFLNINNNRYQIALNSPRPVAATGAQGATALQIPG